MQNASTSGFLEMTSAWMLDADFLLYSGALIAVVCGLHFNESARESRGRGGFAAGLPWLAVFSWCIAANLLFHTLALNVGGRMAWYAGIESILKLASLAALAMCIAKASSRSLSRVPMMVMALASIACVVLALRWPVIGIILAVLAVGTVAWITRHSRDACWSPVIFLLVPVATAPWMLTIYRNPIANQSWMQERWSGDSFLWVSLSVAVLAVLWLFGILTATYCTDRKAGDTARVAAAAALAVVLVVTGSIIGVWWLGDGFTKEHIREETGELTARVATAALAIDYDVVAALQVGDELEETPQLEETRRILRELIATNPDLAVCYLWIIQDGTLYFLAIEDRGGFSSKLAGAAFRQTIPKDVEAYERTFPFVFGPLRDDWGVYTAANALIAAPPDADRVVWLGMDFKVESLLRQRAASRLNAKGLGLICCGALSVAGIFRRRSRREERLHMAIEHAADDERTRLAMELHDGLGQKLTAITLLGQAASTADGSSAPSAKLTRQIATLARDIRCDILLTIRGLGPVELSQGLESALRGLVEPLADSGVALDLVMSGHPSHLPRNVQADLFRIAQEAIHNALRHGAASHIHLLLSLQEKTGSLLIENNGPDRPAPPPIFGANENACSGVSMNAEANEKSKIGPLSPAHLPTPVAPTPGWGLNTMTRRAHRIGGILTYGARQVGGFQVLCTFPV